MTHTVYFCKITAIHVIVWKYVWNNVYDVAKQNNDPTSAIFCQSALSFDSWGPGIIFGLKDSIYLLSVCDYIQFGFSHCHRVGGSWWGLRDPSLFILLRSCPKTASGSVSQPDAVYHKNRTHTPTHPELSLNTVHSWFSFILLSLLLPAAENLDAKGFQNHTEFWSLLKKITSGFPISWISVCWDFFIRNKQIVHLMKPQCQISEDFTEKSRYILTWASLKLDSTHLKCFGEMWDRRNWSSMNC